MYVFYARVVPLLPRVGRLFQKAYNNNDKAGLGVYFVGIQDSVANLAQFAQTHKLKFPVTVSGGESLASSVGVKITPTTIFVDDQGVIRSIYFGKGRGV